MTQGTQFVLVTAFIPSQGKILVAQRALDDDFLPGHWEFFGGKTDFGENPYAAVVREVKEEAGLDIKPIRPYFLFSQVLDDGRHAVDIAFHCELLGKPDVTLSHEHNDFRWINQNEIHALTPLTSEMRDVMFKGFEA